MCQGRHLVIKRVKEDAGLGRIRRARLQGPQVDGREKAERCEGGEEEFACVCGSESSRRRGRCCR